MKLSDEVRGPSYWVYDPEWLLKKGVDEHQLRVHEMVQLRGSLVYLQMNPLWIVLVSPKMENGQLKGGTNTAE